jgi:hypothetical protein
MNNSFVRAIENEGKKGLWEIDGLGIDTVWEVYVKPAGVKRNSFMGSYAQLFLNVFVKKY